MKTEILSQEKNKVVIKAEMDTVEFTKNVNATIRDLSRKVNIPGFRKGKVPRNVLEMRFTKEAIYTETLDSIMPEIINEIVNDYELDLIEEPDLKIETMGEGKPLELVFTFEVSPQVILPELEKVEVIKKEVVVTDEMIDTTMLQIQNQFAEYPTVESRSKIISGDMVDISYVTRVLDENDESIKSHDPGETTIDLGMDGLKEEIRNALCDSEVGDHIEVEVPIEEDNPDLEIAGKRAMYSIDIKGIKEKIIPELNSDFFRKVTGETIDSLPAFRNHLEKGILSRLENENKLEMENMAIDRLAELAEFDIPDTLVRRQEISIREQDEENFKKRFHKTIDEFFEDNPQDKEEYHKNMTDQAQKAVARYLVIDALAKELNIDITKEDIYNEVAKIASTYNIDVEKLMGTMLKDQERLREISNRVRYQKTVEALFDRITIKQTTGEQTEEIESEAE